MSEGEELRHRSAVESQDSSGEQRIVRTDADFVEVAVEGVMGEETVGILDLPPNSTFAQARERISEDLDTVDTQEYEFLLREKYPLGRNQEARFSMSLDETGTEYGAERRRGRLLLRRRGGFSLKRFIQQAVFMGPRKRRVVYGAVGLLVLIGLVAVLSSTTSTPPPPPLPPQPPIPQYFSSCAAILKNNSQSPSGAYEIGGKKADGTEWRLNKVYCDMETDGGGWTLVANMERTSDSQPPFTTTAQWKDVVEWETKKLAPTTSALNDVLTNVGFSSIRFNCRKPSVGRTINIATLDEPLGHKVVEFFTGETDVMPAAPKSFKILPDDDSVVAKRPEDWGYDSGRYKVAKWSHGAASFGHIDRESRIYDQTMFCSSDFQWTVDTDRNRHHRNECDDFVSNPELIGKWQIFVR